MSDDGSPTDTSNRAATDTKPQEQAPLSTALAGIPTVTQLTLVVALLALPVLVALIDALGLTLGPMAENALQWAVALVVLGVVVGVEDRPLSSVGFRWPAWRDLAYLVGTAAATLAIFVLGSPLVEALGLPVVDGASRAESGPGLAVALVGAVTTGVVEEILYRGYPLERLLEYTDSAAVAGSLTVAVFTLAHLVSWPVGNVVQVAAVSVLLTVVYLRRRTLFPVAGAHVGIWVVAVLAQYYA